jgi:rubrerythrin
MRPSPLQQTNNKTGISQAPEVADDMAQASAQAEPSSTDRGEFAATHAAYVNAATPVATMPPPSSEAGSVPPLLIDKLAERLAFERSGVRLYEALLLKLGAGQAFDGGPSEANLQHIRDEEYEHFQTVREAIELVGGDPTAVTPSANLVGVESSGIQSVVTDPRADLAASLHAMLIAELTDNAGWEQLIEACRAADYTDLAERFESCLVQEAEHLASVRRWLDAHTAALLGAAAAE